LDWIELFLLADVHNQPRRKQPSFAFLQ